MPLKSFVWDIKQKTLYSCVLFNIKETIGITQATLGYFK